MEDQTAILSGSLQADPFETQRLGGYNKRQVDDYLTRTNEQLVGLEARLAAALDAAERARLEVAALREQHQQQAVVRPAHEEVSERLSQILRLASEEAEQERGKAEAEIARMREEAGAEVEALRTRTRAEADHDLTSARHEAETVLGNARAEAEQLLTSSRQEAERILAGAQEHAERLRGQAERRAAAVNGVLDERLAAITDAHGTAVRRLAEIRETIGTLLTVDAEAGSITASVPSVERAELDEAAAAGERAVTGEPATAATAAAADADAADADAVEAGIAEAGAEAAVSDDTTLDLSGAAVEIETAGSVAQESDIRVDLTGEGVTAR